MYANAAYLFQEKGVEMFALSTGKNIGDFSSHFEAAGIKVWHKHLPGKFKNISFLQQYFKSICELISTEKIDVMHIHRASYFLFFSLIGHKTGIKTIRTVHNVFKNKSLTWPKAVLERFLARKLFSVTFQTIGQSVYENERHYYKNPSIKVNNWFNELKFYPASGDGEKLALRKAFGIGETDFVIISAGSCSPVKNHHDIIRALSILKVDKNLKYVHLGTGQTEAEEKKLAEDLGVFEQILFVGNTVNVREYLVLSDVFVMPSRFEGLSIASIEAMACGLPLILYNVPGLKDLIDRNDNGFLIPQDYKELARAVAFFYENTGIAIEKGQNALKFCQENFSMEKSVDKIIELYKR